MSYYQFKQEQILKASLEEVWDFISSPQNLKKITPEYMGFEVKTTSIKEKMFPGLIIGYKVSPLFNIKMDWLTEITHVKEMEFFVDEQRIGPYALWHHLHHIQDTDQGVLMKDIVTYQPPFGILGDIANKIIIEKKLSEIFKYRHQILETTFNSI
jgi:ligand-binding SRPBCC domain-containing protein